MDHGDEVGKGANDIFNVRTWPEAASKFKVDQLEITVKKRNASCARAFLLLWFSTYAANSVAMQLVISFSDVRLMSMSMPLASV